MTENSVEIRLENLEQQVKLILEKIGRQSEGEIDRGKDWRRSLGMFNDRPLMKQIDDEGRRIRQSDREQNSNDHS